MNHDEPLTDRESKQVDVLLADFQSLKAEIARRSNLQRFVLAGYVALLVYIFRSIVTDAQVLYPIAGMWLGAALALLFYEREHVTIKEFGSLIRLSIAKPISEILASCPATLISSEVAGRRPEVRQMVARYGRVLFWTAFLVIPLLFSVIAAYRLLVQYCVQKSTIMEIVLVGAVTVAALGVICYLLMRHDWRDLTEQ